MFTINVDQSFRKQISQAKQKLHQTHHQIFNKAVEDINRITERYKGVKVSPVSDEHSIHTDNPVVRFTCGMKTSSRPVRGKLSQSMY